MFMTSSRYELMGVSGAAGRYIQTNTPQSAVRPAVALITWWCAERLAIRILAQRANIPLTYPKSAPDRISGGVAMTRTKLFRSNRSQAVRLPKSLAFPDSVKEVSIVQEGMRRVIVPSNAVWDDFFDSPGIDFPERDQPALQDREPL
jgi:antitoxin VapB